MLGYDGERCGLRLDRALVVFDLETTSADPQTAKIVEMSILRLEPDGDLDRWTRRFNPGQPIPAEATAVHGIVDADVRDCPLFRDHARAVKTYFDGADLCGYNLRSFDLPILEREFKVAGIPFSATGSVLDVFDLFRALAPHTLGTAFRMYGDPQLGPMEAHRSADDVAATLHVLDGMLRAHQELPVSPAELACYRADPTWLDRDGRFRWREDGEAVFAFGKKTSGRTLREVARSDRGFLEWMTGQDFGAEAKSIAMAALRGEFPERKAAAR